MPDRYVDLEGMVFEVTSADDVKDDVTCLEFRLQGTSSGASALEVCQTGEEGSTDASVSMGSTLPLVVVEALLRYSRERLVIPRTE